MRNSHTNLFVQSYKRTAPLYIPTAFQKGVAIKASRRYLTSEILSVAL